ncbi:MAG: IclR family transcriptional regulator [Rudaea sp.]
MASPNKPPSPEDRYTVRAVQRALALLQTFLDCDGGLTATEISKMLKLDPSTTFRMLVTLQAQGFVEQSSATGKYHLGVMCLELGSHYLKNNDLRSRALGVMEVLRNQFGETVHLALLEDNEVVYIEKLAGLHPIGLMSSRVGMRSPSYCTGVGKAMLAHLPKAALTELFPAPHLISFTPATVTDWDSLLWELEKVRERGYALDNQEHEAGVKCVAVPIFNHKGIAAAMSISGPAERMDQEIQKGRLIEELQRAGARISIQMGGASWLNDRVDARLKLPLETE